MYASIQYYPAFVFCARLMKMVIAPAGPPIPPSRDAAPSVLEPKRCQRQRTNIGRTWKPSSLARCILPYRAQNTLASKFGKAGFARRAEENRRGRQESQKLSQPSVACPFQTFCSPPREISNEEVCALYFNLL